VFDLMPAIYRRWFIGQNDDSDEPEIAAALSEVGQEPERVLALASTETAKQALAEATERAKLLGVFGAPTFVIGSEVFWGDERLDDAMAWSRQYYVAPFAVQPRRTEPAGRRWTRLPPSSDKDAS
jgi:2-hydroxychromene-2-carboxylate isomerase